MLANEVRTNLARQLDNATDPGEQANVLLALGNAGDPTLLEKVRSFAGHGSEEVRAAAAQAVRRMPGSEPEPLLAQACVDPSPDVRFSAVDAIRERAASPGLSEAVSHLALREPHYQVRARAVNVVVQWYPAVPSLAETLSHIAQEDDNADLRNLAKTALEKTKS